MRKCILSIFTDGTLSRDYLYATYIYIPYFMKTTAKTSFSYTNIYRLLGVDTLLKNQLYDLRNNRQTLLRTANISQPCLQFILYHQYLHCIDLQSYRITARRCCHLSKHRAISVFLFPQLILWLHKLAVRSTVLITAGMSPPTNCKCNSSPLSDEQFNSIHDS